MPMLIYFILLKILEKQRDLFGIVIQIKQILDIVHNLLVKLIMLMKEKKYLIRLEIQKVLIIKQN